MLTIIIMFTNLLQVSGGSLEELMDRFDDLYQLPPPPPKPDIDKGEDIYAALDSEER